MINLLEAKKERDASIVDFARWFNNNYNRLRMIYVRAVDKNIDLLLTADNLMYCLNKGHCDHFKIEIHVLNSDITTFSIEGTDRLDKNKLERYVISLFNRYLPIAKYIVNEFILESHTYFHVLKDIYEGLDPETIVDYWESTGRLEIEYNVKKSR